MSVALTRFREHTATSFRLSWGTQMSPSVEKSPYRIRSGSSPAPGHVSHWVCSGRARHQRAHTFPSCPTASPALGSSP